MEMGRMTALTRRVIDPCLPVTARRLSFSHDTALANPTPVAYSKQDLITDDAGR